MVISVCHTMRCLLVLHHHILVAVSMHGLNAPEARHLRACSNAPLTPSRFLIRLGRSLLNVVIFTVAPAKEASEGSAPAPEKREARAASSA